MPRPKLRDHALRERVLAAALDLLRHHGVQAVTARAVASAAGTSTPAVYELFGDKRGLARALYFEGFRELGRRFEAIELGDDPRLDLRATLEAYRDFALEHAQLNRLMFAKAFAEFEPSPDDVAAGATTQRHILGIIERGIDAGLLPGPARDTAHVVLALAQGLALQETAGALGTTRRSATRRWSHAVDVISRR